MQSFTQTQHEKTLFLGRQQYIKLLEQLTAEKKHSMIVAPKGYGKKALLRRLFSKKKTANLNLKKASISPELLALEIIGSVLHTAPVVHELIKMPMDNDCRKIIDTIDNELQKIRPDQKLLITKALDFFDMYSKFSKKDIIVVWENFEEFLLLKNYSQIKDIKKIFTDSLKNIKTPIIMTAETDPGLDIKTIMLKEFSDDTASEIVERMIGKVDNRLMTEIVTLTAKIPIVLKELCLAYAPSRKKGDATKEIEALQKIFLQELSTPGTPLHTYCENLFTESLNNARGTSLLKIILKTLSREDNLKLSEISRRIYRSAPVTKSLLERLIEVNLVKKEDNTFTFTNPVLKVWCRLVFSNTDITDNNPARWLR